MANGNWLAAVLKAKSDSKEGEEEKINKTKLYFSLAQLDVRQLGLVEKKSGGGGKQFDYISWTHAEMAMKVLDPESNVSVIESIYPNMIHLEIRYLGDIFKSYFPILDNTNSGAVLDTAFKQVGDKIVQKDELVFWQAQTKSVSEGRKQRVTSMNINNSIQRGMAKEISRVTGFGISVFTGEDLIQYDLNE